MTLEGGRYAWIDVTNAVQAWKADPGSQHGLLLAVISNVEQSVNLASTDHSLEAWHPRLEITLNQ